MNLEEFTNLSVTDKLETLNKIYKKEIKLEPNTEVHDLMKAMGMA